MTVTIRRNDYPQPVEGGRLSYTERRRLQTLRRGRDELVRRLLARGVPAADIAEAIR